MSKMKIEIYTFLDGEHLERLEDRLVDFLKEQGVVARIDNQETGNTTWTKR